MPIPTPSPTPTPTPPPVGTVIPGSTGVYGARTLQDVIDRFNTSKGAPLRPTTGKPRTNHPIYIAWMANAAVLAQGNHNKVSTIEIPAVAGRPAITILGDFSSPDDRAMGEFITAFFSSNDPAITAILAPFVQSRTVTIDGKTVTVAPQSVFIALADFSLQLPGGHVLGGGDFYSGNDAEFEIVMNKKEFANWATLTDLDKAQFLYLIIHEMDHRNGVHRAITGFTAPPANLAQFDAWRTQNGTLWNPASIMGTDGHGGFRMNDPNYKTAAGQWDRALSVANITLTQPQKDQIVQNGEFDYNTNQLNRYRHYVAAIVADQATKFGTGAYWLTPQLLQQFVAEGAIIIDPTKTNPAGTDARDYIESPTSSTAWSAANTINTNNEANRQAQLATLRALLGPYYTSLGLTGTDLQQKLDDITVLVDVPESEEDLAKRRQLEVDIALAIADQAAMDQLKQDAAIGAVIGSVLGKFIGGNDIIVSTLSSAVFGTIGQNVMEIVLNEGAIVALPSGGKRSVFDNLGSDLLENLTSAGIGAVSSYLTAELVKTLGISGFAGELANSLGGAVVNQILTNLSTLGQTYSVIENGLTVIHTVEVFSKIGPQLLLTAASSFLAGKLSRAIYRPENVGGQIGAALGSAVAAFLDGPMLIAAFGTGNPVIIGIALVASFIHQVVFSTIGGLIGSIFGGTPVAGADSVYDPKSGQFVTANVYSKHGGSKSTAAAIADNVNYIYNSVLEATGGTLINPQLVQTGNYGMRGKDFVYRAVSSRDKDTITKTFKGANAASDLIKYGSFTGLKDADFDLVGGNLFAKRGLSGSIGLVSSWENFDLNAMMFDIQIARDYGDYLNGKEQIDLLIAISPTSAYGLGWLQTLARADEIGVTRRNESDWAGGFTYFLQSLADMSPANVTLSLIPTYQNVLERTFTFRGPDGSLLAMAGDSIDVRRVDTIRAGAGNDTIDLRGGVLADQRGYTVNDHLNDDIAVSGSDFTTQTGVAVNFTATALRTGVSVTVANDGVTEAAEKFLGQLSHGTGVSIIGGAAEATIIDGTAAKPTLVVGRSFALEGDGYAVFRVTLSKAATGAVTVGLSTAAETALAGTDFGAGIEVSADGLTGWTAATSLSFAAGQTQKYVRVAVLADNGVDAQGKPTNIEGNERFTLTATVTAGATLIANAADGTGVVAASSTGTIVDASMGSTPLAWIDSVTLDEATGQAFFSIARSRAGSTASLTFATADRKALKIDISASVDGGDGNDTIHASDLGDTLLGGAGSDTLYGGRLDDWLLGGDGNDTLNAGSADGASAAGNGNYLDGGDGDDLLIGREGSDWLEGGMGVDVLEGGRGDDILSGGGGKGDSLRGGLGNDQYIFRTGDSDGSSNLADADVVRDESGFTVQQVYRRANPTLNAAQTDLTSAAVQAAFRKFGLKLWSSGDYGSIATETDDITGDSIQAGGEDTLVFGPNISIDDVRIAPNAAKTDLIIENTKTGEKLVLQDWFNPLNKIENIQFADGQRVRIADFDTFILGTDGSEFIYGTNGADFVHAGGGNDVVHLLFGNDFGNGGEGNDFVSGDPGNDIVLGMDGDDIVLGGTGLDTVLGGAGRDEVRGGVGNDIVSGGAGNDFVVGGAGDDVFKFARGDGQDVFVDELSNEWDLVWVSGQGFQAGYTQGSGADASAIFYNGVKIYDGSNTLDRMEYNIVTGRLYRHKPVQAGNIARNSGTDTIEFGIGIAIDEIQFRVVGSDIVVGLDGGADSAAFASLQDKITLKEWAVNAQANGSIEQFSFFTSGTINVKQNGLLAGTDGSDWGATKISAGNDKGYWATGGAGDDEIAGGTWNDLLVGGAGFDWLKGGAGADVLLGGTGNDTLEGGAGGTFYDGNGTDALGNFVTGATGTAAGDTLIGGDGFDVASYASSVTGVTASLLTPATNTGDAAGDKYSSIEGLTGSAFADALSGDYEDNELIGGAGNDSLAGNLGDDTYIFGRGDGQDSIADEYGVSAETIIDGAGALTGAWVDRIDMVGRTGTNYNFVHTIENSETGEVAYRKAFTSVSNTPAIPARDSGAWLPDADGTPTVVNGNTVTRTTPSQPGGFDTLYFDDIVTRIGSSATGIQTIGLGNLDFAFSGADLLITIVGTSDSVRLKNFRLPATATFDIDRGVENIQFADGESGPLKGLVFDASGNLLTTGTASEDLIIDMTAGAHTLTGNAGNDVLSGRDGNDTLNGGDGDDLLSGGAGSDALNGGNGIDTVTYFGSAAGATANLQNGFASGDATGDTFSGIENLIGSDYADNLKGDAGDNAIKGNAGDDTLQGGVAGNDTLSGDAGNDLLYGTVGDDRLDGGEGNDTITGGDDNDLILGGSGDDILYGDLDATDSSGSASISTVNRLVNGSFEDLGDPANDVTLLGAATTTDLPGWYSNTLGTVFGISGEPGNRKLQLDGGTNLDVSQAIAGLAPGQAYSLAFSADSSGASGDFELWWNDTKIATVSADEPNVYAYSVTGAASGSNTLRFVGLGTPNGSGARIWGVGLTGTGGGQDLISGGDGNDNLYGGDGRDRLSGDAGNDNIYGGTGDDQLLGGQGNDQLYGGAGNDTYLISGDGGLDTITTGGGYDNIVFGTVTDGGGATLKPEQLWLTRSGADLIISVTGTGTSTTVKNWFTSTTATTASANAARRILVGTSAITRSDVEALFVEMQRIGSSPWDAQFQAAFDHAWQPLESFGDRFVLTGTSGNDMLTPDPLLIGGGRFEGLAGNDTITATAVDDVLVGGAGNDTLAAGAGSDELQYLAEAGFDAVDGGAGTDRIVAKADNAVIGLSSLTGVEKIDGNGRANVQIQLAAGTTLDLTGIETSGITKIVGSTGNETITGTNLADMIEGGAGNDTLHGAGGDDWLNGGSGVDTIDGGTGTDTADFSSLSTGITADLSLATNQVSGGSTSQLVSIENLVGTSGNDTLRGSAAANRLDGGAGNDTLQGNDGDDVLRGGLGIDSFDGGAGFDTVDYSDKTTGVTISLATSGSADSGTETYANIEAAIGGSGNDTITGTAAANRLEGGAGVDALNGGDGDDTLIGGTGNDSFNGGNGTDTIVYYGKRSDYTITNGPTFSITDNNAADGDDGVDSYSQVEYVQFSDGIVSLGIDVNNAPRLGLPGLANQQGFDNQAFSYTIPATAFYDFDLTDTLTYSAALANGNPLPSWLKFNLAGSPLAFTYAANDAGAIAAIGQDLVIRVTVKDGPAVGGASVTSDFTLHIGSGPGATINGTSGNDNLTGTARAETILAGAGNDIINGSGGADFIDGGDGVNRISYLTSLTAVTLDFSTSRGTGGDAEDDSWINIQQAFGSNFNDILLGGSGADSLVGADGDDRLEGRDGADILFGQNGVDTMLGGDGDDTLYASITVGGAVEDWIDGGSGVDTLWLNQSANGATVNLATATNIAGIEHLRGSTYADTLTGDSYANQIYGDAGNDIVNGGYGGDLLSGDAGNDTLDGGDGNDTINGGSENDRMLGGADADTYDGGTGADTLDFALSAAAVKVNLSGAAVNSVAAGRGSGGDAEGDTFVTGTIENITGSASGDELTGSTVANQILGGAGADTIRGDAGDDNLQGEAGADVIYGDAGVDLLSGGTENDTLYGGTENDTLNGDDGADTLYGEIGNDILNGGAGNDTLDGGTGSDVINGGDGDDTIILTTVSEDTVDGGLGTDTASFAAVSTALTIDLGNATHKLTGIEVLISGSGADTLSGAAVAERIDGGAGDDTIEGRGGADQLIGGFGNDTVTYVLSAAGTAVNSASVGAVTVGATTVATARIISLNGVRVDLVGNTSTNATALVGAVTAQGADAQGDWFHGVENLTGSGFNDQLTGTNSNSIVRGGGGDDLIYGGAGSDTLYGDAGDDVIYGEAGNDTLRGGDGADRLIGGGESDILYGEAGNDILDAGDAGDLLDGGTGNDTLVGGNGADVYKFARGAGQDTIYNYDDDSAHDAVDFFYDANNLPASIKNTDLWFTKSGKDLIVKVLGTTDQITVKDWFTNTTAGDWTAADKFYVDVFLAGNMVNNHDVNMPGLLSIMAGQAEPASFAALSGAMQSQINSGWSGNTPPTVTAAAGNPVSTSEDGSVQLRFVVDDTQTPGAGLTLSASASGGIFLPILPAHIVNDPADSSGKTKILTLYPVGNIHGTSTITLTGSDGTLSSTPLQVSFNVLAVADTPSVSVQVNAAGNTGTAIMLPGSLASSKLAVLTDTDGSEVFDYVKVEGVPIGAVLSDGTNSFTSAAGSTTATITSWNLATLRITPPAGSSVDFTLTLKTRSKENLAAGAIAAGGQYSTEVSTALVVTVNGTPTAVTLTYVGGGVNENVANAVVGTLGVTDPNDATGTYTYKIVGGADAAKFIDPNDGAGLNQLQLASGQSLNFEAPAQIIVRVTDRTNPASPVTFQQTLTIASNNVQERPNSPILVTGATITDGAGPLTLVSGLTLTATDPENNVVSYLITGQSKDWFEVVGNQLRLKAGVTADADSYTGGATPVTVSVIARDATSLDSLTPTVFTITVTPVDELPSLSLTAASDTVSETGSGAWAGIGLSGVDPETGLVTTFEIDSTRGAASSFQIVGSTLKLTGALDYENRPALFGPVSGAYATTIYVRSKVGAQTGAWQAFTFNLTDVNEAPSPLSDFSCSIAEVTAGDTLNPVIATLGGAVDPEGLAVTYSFAAGGNPNGWFQIVGNQLRINTVSLPNGFDFESLSNPAIAVSIVAQDPALNTSATRTSTITITNRNDAPVAVNDTLAASVTEDAASLTIGEATLMANDTDQDAGDTRHVTAFSATSTLGASLTSVNQSGVVTLYYNPSNQFNYLAAGQFVWDTFNYTITDSGGKTSQATASVKVTGVNDAPVIGGITWLAGYENGVIRENLDLNTPLAIVSATDPDAVAGTLTFNVSDPALQVQWNIGLSRYELRIKDGYNYEVLAGGAAEGGANITRNLTITAQDTTSSSAASNVTVYVKDEEAPIYNGATPSYTYWGFDPQTNWQAYISTNGFASGYYLVYLTTWTDWTGTLFMYQVRHDVAGDGMMNSDDVVVGMPGAPSTYLPGYYITADAAGQPTSVKLEMPIVLDLDGDGLDLVSVSASSVFFDQGADGSANRTGWVGASDGILVFDRNRNGLIENASEISFVGDKAGAKTDLEGLAGFDTNGDGMLDARDSRFAELQVWQDLNQDGVSQAGELRYLTEAGITAIDLHGQSTGQSAENATDNVVLGTTRFLRADGSEGLAGDVGLAYLAASTPAPGPAIVPAPNPADPVVGGQIDEAPPADAAPRPDEGAPFTSPVTAGIDTSLLPTRHGGFSNPQVVERLLRLKMPKHAASASAAAASGVRRGLAATLARFGQQNGQAELGIDARKWEREAAIVSSTPGLDDPLEAAPTHDASIGGESRVRDDGNSALVSLRTPVDEISGIDPVSILLPEPGAVAGLGEVTGSVSRFPADPDPVAILPDRSPDLAGWATSDTALKQMQAALRVRVPEPGEISDALFFDDRPAGPAPQGAPIAVTREDLLPLLMAQQMAGFGARAGEGALDRRNQTTPPPFDYFAAGQ